MNVAMSEILSPHSALIRPHGHTCALQPRARIAGALQWSGTGSLVLQERLRDAMFPEAVSTELDDPLWAGVFRGCRRGRRAACRSALTRGGICAEHNDSKGT